MSDEASNKIRPRCVKCNKIFSARRRKNGYVVCMPCGDKDAVIERRGWTVVPMHKSNYTRLMNPADLIGINTKTVR